MYAFNVNISLSSVFDYLLVWIRKAQLSDTDVVQRLLRRAMGVIQHWHSTLYNSIAPSESPRSTPHTLQEELVPIHTVAWGMRTRADRRFLFPEMDGRALSVWHRDCRTLFKPSFHIVVHRFAANVISEATKADCLAPMILATAASKLAWEGSEWLEERHLRLNFVELPLSVLILSAQVRVGMWRRNGQSMHDQVMNYSEPPFCKMFRDLDLVLLQWGALTYPTAAASSSSSFSSASASASSSSSSLALALGGASTGLSAEQVKGSVAGFLNHLCHRFGVWHWLLGEDARASAEDLVTATEERRRRREEGEGMAADGADLPSAEGKEAAGDGVRVGPGAEEKLEDVDETALADFIAMLDLAERSSPALAKDETLALCEELLVLVILLVTELPTIPDAPEHQERTKMQVRREVVHRLAAGSCTHSEVLECLHLVPKHDQLGPQGLDDILAEVSNRRPAQGLEPDKFKLKDELWIEYDPTFFHLSLQGPLFPSVICPRFPATLATPNPARSSA